MITKIQNLNGTHNKNLLIATLAMLFMMSKIQNLNGTHNCLFLVGVCIEVVYDVKDTKFEWNSQRICEHPRGSVRCL